MRSAIVLWLAVCSIFAARCPALAQCTQPLDDDTLQALTIGTPYPSVVVTPGSEIDLKLYRGFGEPVNACVSWSFLNGGLDTLDPSTGHLGVFAAGNRTLLIAANVENGRRIVPVRVSVYTPDSNPLTGFWTEIKRFDSSGREIRNVERIQSLIFWPDGTMLVTQRPFEYGYSDYTAQYLLDSDRHQLAFTLQYFNTTVTDTDGFGRFEIRPNGDLVLSSIGLGLMYGENRPASRYVFHRVSKMP